MVAARNKAVIDADFFNKITNDGTDTSLFKAVMDEFSFEPVMHLYVYDYELAANSAAHTLVNQGYITIEDESMFWATNAVSYQRLFLMLYRTMNGKQYSGVADVRAYHHSGENLGEIRSSLLALYNGYNYFMSDDQGAKYYITSSFSSRHPIKIMNLYDTFEEIGNRPGHSLKWKDIKGMLKQRLNTKKYEMIRNIWVQQ